MTALTALPLREFLAAFNHPIPVEFYHSSVGIDHLFDELATATKHIAESGTYPPHNIVEVADNLYEIEMAVAGFDMSGLDITLERGVLTVSGTRPERPQDGRREEKYLYRGLSFRSFIKRIPLAKNIEVRSASLTDGVLRIQLERIVPEQDKPRKIPITARQGQLTK